MPKGLGIMIAIPKGGDRSGDIGEPDGLDSAPPSKRGAPPMHESEDGGGGGKVGPEDVDYSDNDLCETCANMGSDGNCTKYGFPVDRTGHCEAGYEPKGEEMGEGQQPSSEEGDEGEPPSGMGQYR